MMKTGNISIILLIVAGFSALVTEEKFVPSDLVKRKAKETNGKGTKLQKEEELIPPEYVHKDVNTSGLFVVDFMEKQFNYSYYLAHKFCVTNKKRGTLLFDNQQEEIEFLWFAEFNPEYFKLCPTPWTSYRKLLDTEWRSFDDEVYAFGSLSDMWNKHNHQSISGLQCVVVDSTLTLRPVSCYQPTVCFLCELYTCIFKDDRCLKLLLGNVPSAMAAHRMCVMREGRLSPVRGKKDLEEIIEFLKKNGALKPEPKMNNIEHCHTVTLGMRAKREYETYELKPMGYESRLISMRKGYFNNQCLVFSPKHFFRLVPEDCSHYQCVICRKMVKGENLIT